MTLERMVVWLHKDRNALSTQINKLTGTGYHKPKRRGRYLKKAKSSTCKHYLMPEFMTYEIEPEQETGKRFTFCDKEERCADCFYRAGVHLAKDDAERKQIIKGERFKTLPKCDYN